jgi:hypothetical protein
LEKISVADAVWWNTLDVVPPPRLLLSHEFKSEHGTAEHAKRYNEHDFQVKRLGKMIRDLWGRQ